MLKQLNKVALATSILLLTACGGDDNNDFYQQVAESRSQDKAFSLSILHINDHHSHIKADDFDYDVSSLNLVDENNQAISEVEVSFGGFPMLTTLFNQLEAQSANVIKLHSGDAITGTLYYSLFNGQADAAVMNEICFDAFALGNHEFDSGDAGLATFLDYLNNTSCQTPALAANVIPANNSPIRDGYISPYTIIEKNGQLIAVIGIDIAGKTKNSSRPDAGTQFLDELTTAQQYIDEVRMQGVNKVVLLTHYQYENDIALASQLSGVDIIVGGDSHTLLGSENLAMLGFNPQGDYPTQVTNADGEKVCIVQAWEYARVLGQINIDFDSNGVVQACSGMPYLPTSDQFAYEVNDEMRYLSGDAQTAVVNALSQYPEVQFVVADEASSTLIASFDEQVGDLVNTVIGQVSEDLCLDRYPGQGRSKICDASATYAYGSDISNIVAKAFLTVTPSADIAIQNGGGVRVDVASGDYTIADVYTLLPFSNTLVTLELTGEQIKQVLEDALSNTLDNQGSSGSYPYASGLRYQIDASQTAGSRVSNIEVNTRLSADWVTIDPTMTYNVVTNDYIASGRDGYLTFGEVFNQGKFVDTYTEYAQGFIDYVKLLNANNQVLSKLPMAEYSTQKYIGRDGCDHSTSSACEGY
ncbi:NAD nucleotidase [Catenovulum sp. SM1970]|uniref:NAD nucleotidase n=1 Tax=Marinifaba aquimaris TaxID=2741323 RepID=UPI001572D62D|nr:NAD nucleotidase [Marinifaba aquimaris]NTS77618.1 NAD nucleotidase [Marinifaba aquimaris]